MKYRETVGMASVEYEGTPQEIHALLLLIEEGSEKTSKAIKNILKEDESKAQEEVASCSDINIQSGSTVIMGRFEREVNRKLRTTCCVSEAINESVVEGLKNIEKASLSGQTIV